LREDAGHVPSTTALPVAVTAADIALRTGRLGGALVDRLRVGVDDDAHLDARRRSPPGSGIGRKPISRT